MYTIHPDDILIYRGANPRTRRISPVSRPASNNDCPQAYHLHPSDAIADFGLVTNFSSAKSSRRSSYHSALSTIIPPTNDTVPPAEHSVQKPPKARTALRQRIFGLFRRRKKSGPVGEGVVLRAKLSR